MPAPGWVNDCSMLFRTLRSLVKREKRTHRWRRKQARTMIADFQNSEPEPARIFARVRAMDALAFEELVMEAFASRRLRVRRSKRYSGDGGIDGEVRIDGQWVLLQMKRYKGSIAVAHVRDFQSLCAARGKGGLFVHTGKTTSGSKALFDGNARIHVISGQKLVDLLAGRDLLIK